ncbi:YHS domain-containing protein [Candidatus Entotheonella palauensis]|uniref:HTH marR-type domain-containing protein n=1 Tax=Candidatus Entotheonella gemina TaxID=1429439 RepID=W4M342_9BACT|nr:YHS domain-containing protein [Candidatus Entotheonella palauensis]ETX04351.1 MAG: hypothetical protein ETSY2_29300 [Candidatus Entotheonella gemina]
MLDPVCGMDVDPGLAAATSIYAGITYYFCTQTCEARFQASPETYLDDGNPLSQYARSLYTDLHRLRKHFGHPSTASSSLPALSTAEWETILLLGQQGACNMRQIAATCRTALSTMTGIVDRLETNKALVRRLPSATDRRVVLVQLTEEGQRVYRHRLESDMQVVLTLLQPLTPQEQQMFVACIHKGVHQLAHAQASDPPTRRRYSHGNHTA